MEQGARSIVPTEGNSSTPYKDLVADWAKLPADVMINIFIMLDNEDRASLSSVSRDWRHVGSSKFLWSHFDMRLYDINGYTASILSSRSRNLECLSFKDAESPQSIINLHASGLKKLMGYNCIGITDYTLSLIVVRHPFLETILLGPDFSVNLSSDPIITMANYCHNLQQLRMTGLRYIRGNAINALAIGCPNLIDIEFADCGNVDAREIADIVSVQFLSVSGTQNLDWDLVCEYWAKLPNLVCLDISRTNVNEKYVKKILSSFVGLKVLCTLRCPLVANRTTFSHIVNNHKVILCNIIDLGNWLERIRERRGLMRLPREKKEMAEMLKWTERAFLLLFVRIYRQDPQVSSDFWISPVGGFIYKLVLSRQTYVSELAMEILSDIIIIEEDGVENARGDEGYRESLDKRRDSVINCLLEYAKTMQGCLQLQAIKAVSNILLNTPGRESIVKQGGIALFSNLIKKLRNKLMVEAIAKGLYNLSILDIYKALFIRDGVIEVLVNSMRKWANNEDILEQIVATLANLTICEKCSAEIVSVGAIQDLLDLAFIPHDVESVIQEQAILAIATLCGHGDRKSDYAGIGRISGIFQALLQVTRSANKAVRLEAVGALWNLCDYEGNPEAIAAAGGIEALIALAYTCKNDFPELQERVAGVLAELSVSRENSVAISRGGIVPLVEFARSDSKDVHGNAAKALCNLALQPCNAHHIINKGGVSALLRVCTSSPSKMACFCSALALACLHDGRVDKYSEMGTSSGSSFRVNKEMVLKEIGKYISRVCDEETISDLAASSSSSPSYLLELGESMYIRATYHLQCGEMEIRWLLDMVHNSYPEIKACAAFALLQLIASSNRHSAQHLNFVKIAGGLRILHVAAVSEFTMKITNVISKILLTYLGYKYNITTNLQCSSSLQRKEK